MGVNASSDRCIADRGQVILPDGGNDPAAPDRESDLFSHLRLHTADPDGRAALYKGAEDGAAVVPIYFSNDQVQDQAGKKLHLENDAVEAARLRVGGLFCWWQLVNWGGSIEYY